MTKSMIFFCTLILVFMASCASDKPTGSPKGTFELYLQDVLADYDSIIVAIDSISIRPAGGAGNWYYINVGSESIDLALLRNGYKRLLQRLQIPVGVIGSVRVVFDSSQAAPRVIVQDTSYNMAFSPLTGRVVVADYEIAVARDDTGRGLIDVDLRRSILYDTVGARYIFQPEITLIDIDSTGSIYGTITPRCSIYLFTIANDTVAFSVSEGSSDYFGFYGLETGMYDIKFEPRGTDWQIYDTLRNYNISIFPGINHDMGVLELPLRGGQ